jgi:hypothetical protein
VSQTKAQLLDGSVVSVAFSAGSAAAPSVYYSADATTGVYFPNVGQIAFSTGGISRLAITSTGAVSPGATTTNTGTVGQVLTSQGSASAPTWTTIGGSDVTQAGNNAFTGANTFYNVTGQTFGTATSTQDGIILAGRAGGATSLRVTLQPGTLTANRTLTLPDAAGTVVTTGDTGSVTSAMLAGSIADTKLSIISAAGKVTNTATTATSLNTASAIVARDSSGNFSAGTITASLTGTASNVTTNANLTGDVTSSGNNTSIAAGVIVNADINASASIADTKLATISTAGKVSNSATTATSSNTGSAIVARDSSGNFLASAVGFGTSTISRQLNVSVGSGDAAGFELSSGSASGACIVPFTSRAAGTVAYFVYALAGGSVTFVITNNGDVRNTTGVYSTISDIKLKENIIDANSQWDDLKAIRVRNFNFKKGETHTQIGFIAQELEEICPGLVGEAVDRDAEGNDLSTTTKNVKSSVLFIKAVKALQEAMERIETLEAKVAALETA